MNFFCNLIKLMSDLMAVKISGYFSFPNTLNQRQFCLQARPSQVMASQDSQVVK